METYCFKNEEAQEKDCVSLEAYKEYSLFKWDRWMKYLIGRRVHLKSTKGMFLVKRVTKNKLLMSCNTREDFWVHNSDFLKLAGGKYKSQRVYYHDDPDVTGLPY